MAGVCWGPRGAACPPPSALRAFLTVPVPPPSGQSQTRLRFADLGSELARHRCPENEPSEDLSDPGQLLPGRGPRSWPGRGPGAAPSQGFRVWEGVLQGTRWGLVPAGPLLGREGGPRVREAGTPRGLPACSSSTCLSVALGHGASIPCWILCHAVCSRPALAPAPSPVNVSLSADSEYPFPAHRVWVWASPLP